MQPRYQSLPTLPFGSKDQLSDRDIGQKLSFDLHVWHERCKANPDRMSALKAAAQPEPVVVDAVVPTRRNVRARFWSTLTSTLSAGVFSSHLRDSLQVRSVRHCARSWTLVTALFAQMRRSSTRATSAWSVGSHACGYRKHLPYAGRRWAVYISLFGMLPHYHPDISQAKVAVVSWACQLHFCFFRI